MKSLIHTITCVCLTTYLSLNINEVRAASAGAGTASSELDFKALDENPAIYSRNIVHHPLGKAEFYELLQLAAHQDTPLEHVNALVESETGKLMAEEEAYNVAGIMLKPVIDELRKQRNYLRREKAKGDSASALAAVESQLEQFETCEAHFQHYSDQLSNHRLVIQEFPALSVTRSELKAASVSTGSAETTLKGVDPLEQFRNRIVSTKETRASLKSLGVYGKALSSSITLEGLQTLKKHIQSKLADYEERIMELNTKKDSLRLPMDGMHYYISSGAYRNFLNTFRIERFVKKISEIFRKGEYTINSAFNDGIRSSIMHYHENISEITLSTDRKHRSGWEHREQKVSGYEFLESIRENMKRSTNVGLTMQEKELQELIERGLDEFNPLTVVTATYMKDEIPLPIHLLEARRLKWRERLVEVNNILKRAEISSFPKDTTLIPDIFDALNAKWHVTLSQLISEYSKKS